MTSQPLISVLIPVYNTEKYLARTIQSIIDQTFSDWELICVNDGSTDNSPHILANFAKNDNRIKILQKENSGWASIPLNLGLNHSQGQYIIAVGCDDYLSSDCLEKALTKAKSTQADSVVVDMEFVYPDQPEKKGRIWQGLNGDRSITLTNRQAVELSLDWQIHGAILWNGDLLRKTRFEESGMNGDEFTVRFLLLNSNKIVFSEGIYYYMQHMESITKKISPRIFETFQIDRKVLELLIENKFPQNLITNYYIQCFINLCSRYLKLLQNKSLFDREMNDKLYCKIQNAYFCLQAIPHSIIVGKQQIIKRSALTVMMCNFIFFKAFCYFNYILRMVLKK